MKFIRQGATHKVVLGPAVAVGDGFTPVTTLALSSADEAEAILHDNGTVVDLSGYTWAAITTADGYYHLTLQSGISNTVGHLTIVVNDDSLCLPLREDFMVLEEAVYDALFAGSALGYVANAPVNVAQISGDATAADNLEAILDGTGGVNIKMGQLWLDSSEALGSLYISNDTGPTVYIHNTVDGGNAVYVHQEGNTGSAVFLLGDTYGLLSTPLNNFMSDSALLDQINAQVDAAIETYRLDHLLAASVAGTDVADNSVIAKMVSKSATADWDSFVNTTESLEALRDRGDAAWVTATGFSTHSAADVWAVATRVLTAGTNIQLPSNGLANITTWTIGITGDITGNLSGSVGSVTGNVGGNVTGTIGGLSTAAKAEVEQEALDALQQTVPDSVPSDGTRPSMQQAAYMIVQYLTEKAVSGTTLTVKKPDGSTTLFTITLNDATSPTSATRSG